MVAAADAALMQRALALAIRGRGTTTPNPMVGAVVVAPDGVVVGQGAHLRAGGPHAEVIALDEAGPRARGATLYCTLEPCSHTGRTGPCTERVEAAGIARVVIATRDPNPQVAGRGVEYLRARGIDVVEGVEGADAAQLNAPFFHWVVTHRPFVILKMAVSADGFVGQVDRAVRLTEPGTDRYFHRERAAVDAIAVGSGTVLVDDPLLTPRGAFRERPLVRVVFDWRGRIPATARLFSTLATGPVIMVTTAEAAARQAPEMRRLEDRGVQLLARPDRSLRPVLDWLGEREIVSLVVEGGPALHEAFWQAGLVNRVQWIATPRRLGEGVPAAPGPARDWQAHGPGRVIGADTIVEWDVHGTDRNARTA